MSALASRMSRELKALQDNPPVGVLVWPINDKIDELGAEILGPPASVYEGGVFRLKVLLPARYPFEPPKVTFTTPVYHPNIDPEGRICLDLLNMPPKGSWRPSLNISTLLAGVGQLLAEPNPDDGLVPEITQEYHHHRAVFEAKARALVQRHANRKEMPLSEDLLKDNDLTAAPADQNGASRGLKIMSPPGSISLQACPPQQPLVPPPSKRTSRLQLGQLQQGPMKKLREG